MLPCTPRSLKVIVTTNVFGDSKSRSASKTFPSWWLGNFKDGTTKNAGKKSYIGDFKHSMLSMWWFWHVLATSPFFAGKSTQYWFILLANASEICYKRVINSYLSKHHVTSVPWHSCISPPWRAAGIKALSLRRGHGRTFAKSLAHGMAGGAAGVPAAGCAEAAGTWHQWEGKAWALRKTCRNYWSPSWNIHSSTVYVFILIYIYIIYICVCAILYRIICVCMCVCAGLFYIVWLGLCNSWWRKASRQSWWAAFDRVTFPSTPLPPRFSSPKAPMKRAEWGLEGLVLLSVERFSWTCGNVVTPCNFSHYWGYISVDVQISKLMLDKIPPKPNWQRSQSWRSNQIQATIGHIHTTMNAQKRREIQVKSVRMFSL